MKIIELIINPQGRTTLQTRGFAGASCRDASRFLEQALGEKTAEQLTAEFHQMGATEGQPLQTRG